VLIAVLAPLADSLDQQLSAARMLSFLPFFVLGLVVRPGALALLRTRGAQVLGLAVLAGGLGAMVVAAPRFSRSLLPLSGCSAGLGEAALDAGVSRTVFLVAGPAGTAALIAASPRRPPFLATLGQRSLTIYLWQAVVVLIVMKTDLLDGWSSGAGLALAVVASVVATLVLGSAPVARVTDAVTGAVGGLLVRPQVERTDEAASAAR